MTLLSNKHVQRLIIFIIFVVIVQLCIFAYQSARFLYKHFIVKQKNLGKLYGEKSWVIVTGPSSGQGKYFALEMAKHNFNLILLGSERTKGTIIEINKKYPDTKVIFIEKDFRRATEPNFFIDIEEKIKYVDGDISGLINNVGYRTAWDPYHEMPDNLINDSIIVGTIVQSRLSRLVIPYFLKRPEDKSNFIINITAQCLFPTFGLGQLIENHISVPFLSVYEASNAFGFYQGNSLLKEYGDVKYKNRIHIVNVMPGAVVTENTEYLGNTFFAIKADKFANNVIRQLGHYNGNIYGYWGHEFSILLVNMFPFIKDRIIMGVGKKISSDFMNKPLKKY